MKKTTFLLIFLAVMTNSSSTPKISEVFQTSEISRQPLRPGKDFALFFAINQYDLWDDLVNPISDVEAIAKDLKDLYGFETDIVRNPTKVAILDKIEEYRGKTYDKDAQLLIFFSGHGEFNEATKQGYFVPKNGLKNDSYGDSYIEYEGLKRRISSLPCEHILLALDACYSGTADESIAMKGGPGKRPGENADAERERYISTSLEYKTRLMLTSGAKVRTPDKSDFVAKFLTALRSQGGDDRLINSPELLGYLTTASPKPVASTFGEHAPGGEFLFIQTGSNVDIEPTENTLRDLKAWQAADAKKTREAYEEYKRGFCPEGAFCEEVELKIKVLLATAATDGLVFVQGGTFTMGCTSEQGNDCLRDEKPTRQVTLSDFYMGKYEVTQAEWRQVMGSDPRQLHNTGCDQCPVEGVSWDDIQVFLTKLNAQTGRQYRLPTEAEWEYAARGGSLSKGYKYAGSNNIGELAWYEKNYQTANTFGAQKTTHPVGQKKTNEIGLFDMSGSVWEWCGDLYGTYPSSAETNPTGFATGLYRVRRGGSWNGEVRRCRVSSRVGTTPVYRSSDLGFRVASSPQ